MSNCICHTNMHPACLRAALDEAVAEERKALREIILQHRPLSATHTAIDVRSGDRVVDAILAALDARSKP